MKFPENIQIPRNIRPPNKKTRFWMDNEILQIYAPKLKPAGIALYCALAMHANSKTQSCFPSYPRLMQMSGIGKRNTIGKYLKILEGLDLILIDRNKKRQPNRYWMLQVDSTQMDTNKKYTNNQKEQEQYLTSHLHSTDRDTLNQRINSNKEMEIFSIEEDFEIKESVFKASDFTPEFIKEIRKNKN
ncbi:MAG: helix-turn-helix domain-containing protein [Candidatus Nomurabacteria bacterium]|nr:helix-turn-helix domain-containing protein [Candidatus Nomurabacteria bacterium]